MLVFGGSLGAQLLNELAVDAWGASGPGGPAPLRRARLRGACARRVARPAYRLLPFLDEIGLAYGAADLVVARAGGSVWELAAAGLPAVLVPGSFATGDHQDEERALVRARQAAQSSCPRRKPAGCPTPSRELLADPDRLAAMAAAMRSAARPNAAEEIADEHRHPRGRSPVGASGSPASAAPA